MAMLAATGTAEIVHRSGKSDPCETILTEAEFCARLVALRSVSFLAKRHPERRRRLPVDVPFCLTPFKLTLRAARFPEMFARRRFEFCRRRTFRDLARSRWARLQRARYREFSDGLAE